MVKTKQGIGKGKEKERKGKEKDKGKTNYGKSCKNEPKMIALGTLGDQFLMIVGAWGCLACALGRLGP